MATPNLGLTTPVGTDTVDLLSTYPSDMTKIDTAYANVSESAQNANTLAGQAKTQAQSASDASSANANALVAMGNRVSTLETNESNIPLAFTKNQNVYQDWSGGFQKSGIKCLQLNTQIVTGLQAFADVVIGTTNIKPTGATNVRTPATVNANGTISTISIVVGWGVDGTVTINMQNIPTGYSVFAIECNITCL